MLCSCHGDSLRLLRPPDLSLQGRAPPRQMAVAFDPPQAWLNEEQRTGHPAVFLVRRMPVIHLVGQLAELGVQGFQAVGGLEAAPQSRKEPPAMEGQRLLQAFIQTGDGRAVEAPQLLTQLAQSRSGLGIRRGARRPVAVADARPPADPSGDSAPRSRACATDTAGRGPGPRAPSERLCAAPWPRR